MKKFVFLFLSSVFVLGITLFGCAREPQHDLEAAEAALAAADSAEADIYASDLYEAAQDSFAVAQAEIERQNTIGGFERNYDRAESLLQFVRQTAAEAETLVVIRKDEMRLDNEDLFAQIEQTVAETREFIAQPAPPRAGTAAPGALQEDVIQVEQTLHEARTAQAEGDFAGARGLAEAALQKINTLAVQLEASGFKPTISPRS